MKTQAFFTELNKKISQGPEWIMELGQLAAAQGMIVGMGDETTVTP